MWTEMDWLEAVRDMNDRLDWAHITGRRFRRPTAERLVSRGLLRSEDCILVDGDGFTKGNTEQWRTGYRITGAGRHALHAVEHERAARAAEKGK